MALAVRLAGAFVLAGALAYAATPYAIALANRFEFFDKPAGYKGHLAPTPYLGGAALTGAFVIAVLAAAGHLGYSAPLLGGAAVLWAVGTVDDRRTVPPGARVLVELALGALVWASGLGWHLHAGGALDLALTCVWIVGVVNAFNLFDNMDGAAGTMALVVSAGVALIGIVHGDVWLAVAAAALCGACLGFLPRNICTPARIFLGDGGSMPVGFAVAVLVTSAAGTSTVPWRSLLVALLLIGIPALDTTLVIVSRRRRGVSVLTGGRDHLTHRTHKLLPSARTVALLLGLIQAALSVLAVLASRSAASLLVISASIYLLAAGATIVLLDTQKLDELAVAPRRGARIASWSSKRALTCLIVLGLGVGLSAFGFSYYDATVWAPIGFAITIACAITLVIAPFRPAGPGALCAGGLLGLGAWALGSAAWSESVENAVVAGNRWLVYGALLLLLLALVSHDRRAAALIGAIGIGIAAVALSVLVRLLGSDPGALFLAGRLNSPLGYINGEGCLFAMGLWPCLAVAESRRALLAGPAIATATLMASLALLTQSRGTALALLAALIFTLAVVPGRVRRSYAVLVIAGALALASPALLHVYDAARGGAVTGASAHRAAVAALAAALGAGVLWALLSAAFDLAARRAGPRALARAGAWLLAIPVTVALLVAAGSTARVEHAVSRQWSAFVRVAEPGEAQTPSLSHSRLLSGAGNRYDYWRIAWSEWQRHPLIGLGAGNYQRPYFERRATTEDVEQPHSIELQTLSELGIVGTVLLLAFIAGVVWGAVRMGRRAARSPLSRALVVSGAGMFAAWLAQASVDWMHLLPGLSAAALAGAAVLVWPRSAASEADAPVPGAARVRRGGLPSPPVGARRARVALGASAVIVTLIITGASLSRQSLALAFASKAESALARDPAAALTDANRSLGFDADAVHVYYLKAAALARFDRGAEAGAVLTQALAREPRNFVTWALLGDVATRRGRPAEATADYLRAHQLNPRNEALARLALAPRAKAR